MGKTNVRILATNPGGGHYITTAAAKEAKEKDISKEGKKQPIVDAFLNDLKSIPNVAKLLDTAPQSIRNAISDGRIPAEAIVWIDKTYRLIRWSMVKDLKIREYKLNKSFSND
jgi:hypothetical protein